MYDVYNNAGVEISRVAVSGGTLNNANASARNVNANNAVSNVNANWAGRFSLPKMEKLDANLITKEPTWRVQQGQRFTEKPISRRNLIPFIIKILPKGYIFNFIMSLVYKTKILVNSPLLRGLSIDKFEYKDRDKRS